MGRTCTAHDCGAPAVTSWTNRNGVTYWECASHAPASHVPASDGSRTVVVHGVQKTGTVVKETDTFVWVEVPTYGGTASRVVKIRK